MQRVTVNDNQYVEAGTVLVQLDRQGLRSRGGQRSSDDGESGGQLDGDAAQRPAHLGEYVERSCRRRGPNVDNASAGLAAAQEQFAGAQASLREAEANDLKAQDDVERYRPLAVEG